MPVVLDRLPLPNLYWYLGVSVSLLVISVYNAGSQVAKYPNWKERLEESNVSQEDDDAALGDHFAAMQERQMTPYLIPEVFSYLIHDSMGIWTVINMAYCVLILLGTLIQRLVFGELRVSEQQHIKDKFWNFVFYKFIFVFGVMNVQTMDEAVLWVSWFSVLGFLHLLAQLCKDRFEYLSFSATTQRRTHVRLLGLLGMILTIATFLLLICVVVGCHSGINTFMFMVAECVLLIVRTLYVITKYCLHLWDITHEGLWEKRGSYVYMTELVFGLSELVIDMVHHIHMLVWSNMLLTMASLVICMQLRLLFYQLQHKIKSHRNHLRVRQLLHTFTEVRGVDLSSEEATCAICWEPIEVGRVLPCSHVFHASCLLAWLHQDLSCPTCRHKLQKPEQEEGSSLLDGLLPGTEEGGMGQEGGMGEVGRSGGSTFPSPAAPEGAVAPGWRYVSWLPSFSVEQSHTQLPRHHQPHAQPASTSQLDSNARQVQQMFPDVSYSHILEDLRRTHSLEVTIDNILEQKIVSPPPMFATNDCSTPSFSVESSVEESEEQVEEEEQFQDALCLLPATIPLLDPARPSAAIQEDSSDTESDRSSVGAACVGSGGRFSKSPQEREHMLAERKNSLLSQARQRFTSRPSTTTSEKGSSSTSHNPDS